MDRPAAYVALRKPPKMRAMLVLRYFRDLGESDMADVLDCTAGTTSIQTAEVFDQKEPILYVSHDADDGLWQLIGASDADPATAELSRLHHAVEHDPTLLEVLDLKPGENAYRTGPDQPWTREQSV
jgi:hypothetical protein